MSPEQARATRQRLHITQADLAQALGVSLPTLQRTENGLRPMPAWYPLALQSLEHGRSAGTWRIAALKGRDIVAMPETYADQESACAAARLTWPAATLEMVSEDLSLVLCVVF